MVTKTELLEFPALTPLVFCLWFWMKGEVYKRKVETRDELLARILDAAGRTKARGDQLEQPRHLRTRVAKCVEADGGIF
jgi:hypothetical protein